ncbi:MAG: hypothetical protein BWY31_04392 [Lentisphaerae bacterium ADurb.Bin242]|nr:MAG: hypothetical protein BWY31_04392 [Lentisphaerae bacterium ADurb.Bin242]
MEELRNGPEFCFLPVAFPLVSHDEIVCLSGVVPDIRVEGVQNVFGGRTRYTHADGLVRLRICDPVVEMFQLARDQLPRNGMHRGGKRFFERGAAAFRQTGLDDVGGDHREKFVAVNGGQFARIKTVAQQIVVDFHIWRSLPVGARHVVVAELFDVLFRVPPETGDHPCAHAGNVPRRIGQRVCLAYDVHRMFGGIFQHLVFEVIEPVFLYPVLLGAREFVRPAQILADIHHAAHLRPAVQVFVPQSVGLVVIDRDLFIHHERAVVDADILFQFERRRLGREDVGVYADHDIRVRFPDLPRDLVDERIVLRGTERRVLRCNRLSVFRPERRSAFRTVADTPVVRGGEIEEIDPDLCRFSHFPVVRLDLLAHVFQEFGDHLIREEADLLSSGRPLPVDLGVIFRMRPEIDLGVDVALDSVPVSAGGEHPGKFRLVHSQAVHAVPGRPLRFPRGRMIDPLPAAKPGFWNVDEVGVLHGKVFRPAVNRSDHGVGSCPYDVGIPFQELADAMKCAPRNGTENKYFRRPVRLPRGTHGKTIRSSDCTQVLPVIFRGKPPADEYLHIGFPAVLFQDGNKGSRNVADPCLQLLRRVQFRFTRSLGNDDLRNGAAATHEIRRLLRTGNGYGRKHCQYGGHENISSGLHKSPVVLFICCMSPTSVLPSGGCRPDRSESATP